MSKTFDARGASFQGLGECHRGTQLASAFCFLRGGVTFAGGMFVTCIVYARLKGPPFARGWVFRDKTSRSWLFVYCRIKF